MRIRNNGSWREVRSGRVRVNGAWRNLTRAVIYEGGAWRNSAQFVAPLTVSISGTAFGQIVGSGTVLTDQVTAIPAGGLGPYTYSWSQTDGPPTFTINTPASATTSFSLDLIAFDSVQLTARCTVTDSLGNTAFSDTTVRFTAINFN